MKSGKPKIEESYLEKRFWSLITWLIIALVALGFVMGLAFAFIRHPALQGLMIGLEVSIGLLCTFVIKKAVGWLDGMKGEYKVSTVLQTIWWKGFRPVDDIRIGTRGNVDHVIVGPSGVWSIETKHKLGDFTLEKGALHNYDRPYGKHALAQAYGNAKEVQKYLASKGFNFGVRPVLCFSPDFTKVQIGDQMISGVHVIGYRWLTKLIDNPGLAGTLDEKQIDVIYQALKALKK